jgi:hypothetical protein
MVCVLAVSDEVDEGLCADLSGVRAAELIVACGDLPFDYLASLMNGLDVPLVFVPGNHDPDLSGYRSSRAGLTLRAGMPVRAPWPDGAVNADRRVVSAGGLRLAGLGGSPRYSPGPNQYSGRQFARRARSLRWQAARQRRRDGQRVDVLLTHAPPRGVGDSADRAHQGFTALHGVVESLRPAVLLHGHVLPCDADGGAGGRGGSGGPGGERRLGATVVRNVTGHHLLDIQPPGGVSQRVPDRGRAR